MLKGTVPLNLLERVIVRGNVQLESRILGALSQRNISLLVLSGRNTEATAMLAGRSHNDSRRRLGQYRATEDSGWRTQFSRRLVLLKIRAQQSVLLSAITARADLRHPLLGANATLTDICERLNADGNPVGLASLRGYEGAAAAAYFSAFGHLFAPALNFTGRKKRPPPDPVNVCLSLGYTLLHYDAVRACHIVGLDPMLGFYHDLSFGRESLACDLMEPLRPILDKWVWQLFSDRLLRPEHFSFENDRCQLGKAGRQIFYGVYESRAGAARRLLRRYAFFLANAFQASGGSDADALY